MLPIVAAAGAEIADFDADAGPSAVGATTMSFSVVAVAPEAAVAVTVTAYEPAFAKVCCTVAPVAVPPPGKLHVALWTELPPGERFTWSESATPATAGAGE